MTGSASICQNMHEFYRFFGPNLKSLTLKLTEKRNFSEINILLCHMTGSALIEPKFKIFIENTNCLS